MVTSPWSLASRRRTQSDKWIGHAVAEVLDLDSGDPGDRKRIRAMLKTWLDNGVLRKVEARDDRRIMRTFVEPGDWSEG